MFWPYKLHAVELHWQKHFHYEHKIPKWKFYFHVELSFGPILGLISITDLLINWSVSQFKYCW